MTAFDNCYIKIDKYYNRIAFGPAFRFSRHCILQHMPAFTELYLFIVGMHTSWTQEMMQNLK